MTKVVFTVFAFLFSISFFGQNIADAKYIQVNKQYDFQDEINEYRLNSTLKSRFEKRGYQVYFVEDGIPQEVKEDPCKALICELNNQKSWLSTILEVQLTDCKGNVVAKAEGKSRLKKHKKSYPEAIDQAFKLANFPVK